jgi:predicted house-cleaning noncanonical NTP pyrophosphatase (MazG superfamily)
MKQFNKLVRDRIPEIIEKTGETPVTRVLEPAEYRAALLQKLAEETAECQQDPCAEELADLQEVILALAADLGLTPEALEAVRAKKAAERGGFAGKIFLESTH